MRLATIGAGMRARGEFLSEEGGRIQSGVDDAAELLDSRLVQLVEVVEVVMLWCFGQDDEGIDLREQLPLRITVHEREGVGGLRAHVGRAAVAQLHVLGGSQEAGSLLWAERDAPPVGKGLLCELSLALGASGAAVGIRCHDHGIGVELDGDGTFCDALQLCMSGLIVASLLRIGGQRRAAAIEQ